MKTSRSLYDLTVSEASQLIRNKDISPVEITLALLERISKVENQVHAWVTLVREDALRDAKEAEAAILSGDLLGPLHGIPFGIKDNYCTAGIHTIAGSNVEPDFVPEKDATVVARLKSAGAILLGKTTTTEYAFLGGTPPTRNPWNLNHTPGGSSTGSGAALAASMALFTLGTQTGGSLLRPAAYNGLTAIKPTFGRISRAGIIPVSWSLDHAGPITRTVEDAAVILKVIAGQDNRDPTTLSAPVPDYSLSLEQKVKGRVLGIPDSYFFQSLDPELEPLIEDALQTFRELGTHIVPVKLPASFNEAMIAHWLVMRTELASYHQDSYKQHALRYGANIREAIELGQLTPAVDYLRAQRIRSIYREELIQLFKQVDALITPTTPTPAPEGITSTGTHAFIAPFTNAGVPSMTIPIGFTRTLGLPFGLQIAAAPVSEELLLSLGHAYQKATNWQHFRPQFDPSHFLEYT